MINAEERRWILCPCCGAKTRLQVYRETELKEFPLFCPKCRRESIVDVKNYIVCLSKRKKPDAETQC
ncbi:MAG: cysteine-rich KTR domain-containing protein [Eubacterium sp.]